MRYTICRKEISKLDESCTSNPKSEISNWTGNQPGTLRQSNSIFRISDLRCRIRPISQFPPLERLRRIVLMALAMLTTAACTQNMANQPRYDPLEASDFFPDSSSARPLPIGTISRDYVMKTEFGETGMIGGKPADRFPFPITAEVMRRGQQRYNIYCSPCHDYVGTGNGMAARRGFRRMPASFHTEDMRMSPPGHFFDVMTNGFGSMPPYANQIAARDRWAITAYIRALQLSQWTTLDSVPEDERRRLEQERR